LFDEIQARYGRDSLSLPTNRSGDGAYDGRNFVARNREQYRCNKSFRAFAEWLSQSLKRQCLPNFTSPSIQIGLQLLIEVAMPIRGVANRPLLQLPKAAIRFNSIERK